MAELKEYVKGKKKIRATERSYEILYKAQGFKPVSSKDNSDEPDPELEALGIESQGSGWYQLKNGEKVQGRDKAIETAKALDQTGEEESTQSDEGDSTQEGDQ